MRCFRGGICLSREEEKDAHTNVIDSMIGRKEVQSEGQDTYILYLQLSVIYANLLQQKGFKVVRILGPLILSQSG